MSSAPARTPSPSDSVDPRRGSGTDGKPQSLGGRASSFLLRTQVDGWVRFTAWASLIANSLLILTGGLVRLTGSGLGCPTWPRCTDESWTSTSEMGIHGAIEFGNRLLTFVLAVVAVLAFLAVVKMRRERRDFFLLTLILGLGIPLQAVVGGITVLTGLNPWVVGIHFMISAVMIYLAATYVNRVRRASLHDVDRRETPGQAQHARGVIRSAALVMGLLTLFTVYLGTLVTGTGPHSGDSGEVVRHTFSAVAITRAHVVPVYALVILVGAVLLLGRRNWPRPIWRSYTLVGVVLILQGLIGYYQYFNGLPLVAVSGHLVGSALMVSVVAFAVEKSFALTAHPADVTTSSATDPTH